MSRWTHINGSIRYDSLRIDNLGVDLEAIKVFWGPELRWEDDFENPQTTLPAGSEGGLHYTIWENPDLSCMASYTVAFFGDLRDFGAADDLQSVKDWFSRVVLEGLPEGLFTRQAVMEVETGDKCFVMVYRQDHYNDIKEIKVLTCDRRG